jgi:23S rRNA pseudouridine2605 synthase
VQEQKTKPERLQKILSANGVASLREAEKMILKGRVLVNGIAAVSGQSALLGHDSIVVDGVPLTAVTTRVYIMLNKPRGYITTVNDEQGRTTVMKLVENVGTRVYPVGRLDMNTEGLLLLTNDGEFANTVMHPQFDKLKTYQVSISGDARSVVEKLSKPIDMKKADTQNVRCLRVKGQIP